MDGLLLYVVGLGVLIFFSAYFSGSEAALFSLNRSQIRRLEQHSAAGREVSGLLNTPRGVLITILIGNLVVNVFSTSAATSVAVKLFGDAGVGIAFVFMSFVIMIFGEIFPKVLAMNEPRRFSLAVVYPLRFFHTIFYIIRLPIAALTDFVIGLFKKRLGFARHDFSREELMTAFAMGRDQGHVGEFESDLLRNIIAFRDTVVKEIMTPSINVFSLPVTMSPEEMEDQIIRSGFSRAPVYGETADDIRGVIHIKELAAALSEEHDFDIEPILRTPHYVPESTRISALFQELGRQRTQLAVVIDEYGSYVGVVTMEDILEELVGEIRDSEDQPTADYTLVSKNRIVVQGTMEIDEFNETFGAKVIDGEHETIAGYVIGATGTIPREGQTIDLGNLRFHIISAQPNRIRKMRVDKI